MALSPVIYVPHGGGPMPLLGDPAHAQLINFLQEIGRELGAPSAIVVISAHWEAPVAAVTGAAQPEMYYDYYGFPPESYRIQYPAPGHPQLANKICELLREQSIASAIDPQRGYDHGVFVPLKLMYPDANIPCIQLSLLHHLDAAAHIALGEALSSLRHDNILFVGSGMPFHNLNALFTGSASADQSNRQFNAWLIETCTEPSLTVDERSRRLTEWEQAPAARFCHPRAEHLLPLHVCFGIAAGGTSIAEVVFNREVIGKQVSAFLWR